ncbi:geranylgeranyl pyrophosphate synthase [Mangrovactinospora gilvigrisea]|uniref:Geranylgeranyl pyrophosphate synthase n=1 Tax=Mangrovactinospora gilvigrisea TaxID=1428644 RepID=A0A1J7BZY9_9ACTN|nr:polyprenyl synthetase family protein [Mangrovactinospora gilvigrisea]OIV39049.1 geranylgeranyl pyrophosphate synthase [Mangrovactinospora gilvigrisea]
MTVDGPFGLRFADPALDADIRAGMAAVEEGLLEATKSDVPFITRAARHLLEAGGKRFRPLLVLLAAQFGDPQAPGVVRSGVVMELTHLATLYHDDVMDEADRRRGTVSANAQWDNSVAILTGDFLFARASKLITDLGDRAVRAQAEAFERLVTGQILETVGPEPGGDPMAHYLEVVDGKTGSLFSASCQFGSWQSGADDRAVELLRKFGDRVGVAFQLADDLLDIASDAEESGKVPGIDLREGIPSLPVLQLRAMPADPSVPGDARLRELLDGGPDALDDDAVLAEAVALFRAHPALEVARRETLRVAADARAVLDPLPDIPAKDALQSLCDIVAHRAG